MDELPLPPIGWPANCPRCGKAVDTEWPDLDDDSDWERLLNALDGWAFWDCLTEFELRLWRMECVRCGRLSPEGRSERGEVVPSGEHEYGWTEDVVGNFGPVFTCPGCLSLAEQQASTRRTVADLRAGGFDDLADKVEQHDRRLLAEGEREVEDLQRRIEGEGSSLRCPASPSGGGELPASSAGTRTGRLSRSRQRSGGSKRRPSRPSLRTRAEDRAGEGEGRLADAPIQRTAAQLAAKKTIRRFDPSRLDRGRRVGYSAAARATPAPPLSWPPSCVRPLRPARSRRPLPPSCGRYRRR